MRVLPAATVLLGCALAAACAEDNRAGPTATDLSGTWTGESTYPNAPFRLSLSKSDGAMRGDYSDRLDRSLAVTATLSNLNLTVVVDFGDAKLNLQGTVLDARTVQGQMFTSALGNRQYPFTMTR